MKNTYQSILNHIDLIFREIIHVRYKKYLVKIPINTEVRNDIFLELNAISTFCFMNEYITENEYLYLSSKLEAFKNYSKYEHTYIY